MKKVFITRKIPEAGIRLLKKHFEVTVSDQTPTKEELKQAVKNYDAIFSMYTRCT